MPPEYPALYHSAEKLARASQTKFFVAIAAHLILLVLGAALSQIAGPSASVAILQALVLLCAVSLSIYLFAKRPDAQWYGARAVAESIKTATWRFVVRAEPFETETAISRIHFGSVLRAIVKQNEGVSKQLSEHLADAQITQGMLELREMKLEARRGHYLSNRIVDQLKWYASKASYNRRRASGFFVGLIVANCIGVALAVARVHFTSSLYWPTDVFIAIAASLLGWVQAKRYAELAASYALAAHEISLIKEQSFAIGSERDFSAFVGDAENAFSREHTQWIARKDE
jgi:hypothetical protein